MFYALSSVLVAFLLSSVHAQKVSVVTLPSFLVLDERVLNDLSGDEFSSLVKSMSGMPPSQDRGTGGITMSGLKTPKQFIFVNLIGKDEVSSNFPTFSLKASNPFDLEKMVSEISDFYNGHANILQQGDSGSNSLHDDLEMLKKMRTRTGPTFFFTSLASTPEASEILKKFAGDCKSAFGDDTVIFAMAGSVQTNSRSKRAATPGTKKTSDDKKLYNLGEDYSEMYPVIFNIILWFSIAMGVTIASVAYCIWFMDPGKDGIIYRMTASRIKKDL